MRRVEPFVLLLFLFLLTFALRVFRLDMQSLWYDEAFSVYLAHFGLVEITARTAADIQPPLYYYLLHFWMQWAGESEFAVRFVSLSFGVLTIPLLHVTARHLFGRRAAAVAAVLAALSPLYVWYSQEARMYTLITFLLLLSSVALLRALSPAVGAGNRRFWVLFTAANIAALYTHYFALVVIAFQVLYALAGAGSGIRATLKPLAVSLAAHLVAFLPWTPFVLARFGQDASYWPGALKLDEAFRHVAISFSTGESVLEAQAQWIAVAWLVVLVVGTAAALLASRANRKALRPSPARALAFALLYLVIPLALLLVLFYRNPKFNARYMMIASPAFFLLLGAGLAGLAQLAAMFARSGRRMYAGLVGVVLVAALGIVLPAEAYADANAYFDPAFTKADFRGVARYISAHIAPDEAIILTSGHLFPAFDYYYRGSRPQIRLPDDPTLNTEHVLGYDVASVLNGSLNGARGAWLVLWQDEVVDPNGFVSMLLSSRGQEEKLDAAEFYHVRLRHWTLAAGAPFSPEPQPVAARPANFKDKIKLLGLTPNPVPADRGASFNLYWQSLDTLTDDYQVALRVRDAAGNLWGKLDRRPAGYTYPSMRWKKGENLFGAYTVPLTPGAPAGNYLVDVTFYTASEPSGLDVLAPNGAPAGKIVTLGPIPVLPPIVPATYASLNIQNNISRALGPFTLLGYQLGRDKASAGEVLPLTLFWRADAQPDRDYSFRISFDGSPADALPLANADYPTGRWRAGEVVRGQYRVAVPADATAGPKQLKLSLSAGTTAGPSLDLAPFTVEKTDRVFVKPKFQFAQEADFAGLLALVGYDVEPSVKPGGTLKVTLAWQARGRMDKAYSIFVHLLDGSSQVRSQQDAQPVNGTRPTTGWVAGEYIGDTYALPIKAETAPGEYRLEIGVYDAADYSRLPVLDASGAAESDHVILKTSIQIP